MSAISTSGHRTLLQLVQTACSEIGMPRPNAVASSNDQLVQQMFAQANREGREMFARGTRIDGWQMLRKEYVWQVVGGQNAYPLPADVDSLIPSTMWDRSMRWPMLGPLTPQEWQVLNSSVNPTGPRRRWRLIDGQLQLFPTPGPIDTSTLVYEYYSTGWCQSSTGTPQAYFAADEDIYLLDDDTMVLGIIWRFRRAKGLAWEDDFKAHERAVERAMSKQAASRTLPLDATSSGNVLLLTTGNIPDTGYGQ